jgi:hypothetical protein
MKQLCGKCGKRRPLSIVTKRHRNPGHKVRKGHDLCRACFEAQLDSNRARELNPKENQ